MPRPEVIQVQFRPEEAERIRRNAEMMGISASAYVRQQLLGKLVVPVWWGHPMDDALVMAVRSTAMGRRMTQPAKFYFEMLKEHRHGAAEYKVYDESGDPLTEDTLGNREWHDDFQPRELRRGRFVFGGDDALWKVVRSVADENLGGQLRWLLEVDDRDDNEPFAERIFQMPTSYVVAGEVPADGKVFTVLRGPLPPLMPLRLRSRGTGIEYSVLDIKPELHGITGAPRADGGTAFGLRLYEANGSLPVPNDTLVIVPARFG